LALPQQFPQRLGAGLGLPPALALLQNSCSGLPSAQNCRSGLPPDVRQGFALPFT